MAALGAGLGGGGDCYLLQPTSRTESRPHI